MVSNGIHNDLIRMMFLSGLVGLFMYLFFLFYIFKSARRNRQPERFLITGSVACILLHSMSALPLMYASYIYLLMSVFAYAVLPYSVKYGQAAAPQIHRKKQSELVAPIAGIG